MPHIAVLHLLRGRAITVIDATQHDKPLTDAQKFGVPTWCLVFNRAILKKDVRVCEWETSHMRSAANWSTHKPLVQTIRKLANLYGHTEPAVIGKNVRLLCMNNVTFDGKIEEMKKALCIPSMLAQLEGTI